MENTEISTEKDNSKKWIFALLVFYALATILGLHQILSRKDKETRAQDGLKVSIGGLRTKGPAIAVVPIYGIISISNQGQMFQNLSVDKITKRLKSISENPDIKAVILRINSPGGSVGAVQEIYDEIVRLKKSGKKVVASMGDIAASGGYYVAAPADKIFADAGTLTGSIGVIFEVGNFQELFKKIGVKIESIKSAEHKDIGSPFRTMTEKERAILKAIIDDAYNQFVDAIVQGRNMPKDKVIALADGRIFTGAQAKKEGLVDELGNMEAAIAQATELAGIKEKPRIIYEENPMDRILSILSQETKGKFWETSLSKFGVRFAYIWEYAL